MPSGLSSSFANLVRGADKSIKDGLSSLERVMNSPVSSPIRNTPSPGQLSEDERAREGHEFLQEVRRERAVKQAKDAAAAATLKQQADLQKMRQQQKEQEEQDQRLYG